MPSKYSENLKQAIQYIRAGEMEIAREIILEIIQNDPEYEKAWIWLVETVTDKAGKVDILKTRLESYPDSPLARKALEHLAPDVLNHLQTENEAVFIPPPVRKSETLSEKDPAIDYDMSSEDMGDDRFGFDDSDLIEFEEPKKESGELFTGEGLFGSDDNDDSSEFSRLLEDEEDEDADEVLEQDLEAFLRGSIGEDDSSTGKTEKPASSAEMTFIDWLQGEEEEEAEESHVDELALLMAQETKKPEDTGSSNPFVLNSEESLALFGEDVLQESEEDEVDEDAVSKLRAMTNIDRKSAFRDQDIEAMDLDDALFPELPVPPVSTTVRANDLLELENGLRKEVVGTARRPQNTSARQNAVQTQKKKQNSKNHAFIWGCSVLAAIIVIALLAMAWLFFQNMKDAPPTPTTTMAPSITPTEAYTLVAPWLVEETVTPTSEGE